MFYKVKGRGRDSSNQAIVAGGSTVNQLEINGSVEQIIEQKISIFSSIPPRRKLFLKLLCLGIGLALIASGFIHLFSEGAVLKTQRLLIAGSALTFLVSVYQLISFFHKNRVPARMKPIRIPVQGKIDLQQEKEKNELHDYSVLDLLATSFDDWGKLGKKYDELDTQIQSLIDICEKLKSDVHDISLRNEHLKSLIDIEGKLHSLKKECGASSVDSSKDYEAELYKFKSLESGNHCRSYTEVLKQLSPLEQKIRKLKNLSDSYRILQMRCEDFIDICLNHIQIDKDLDKKNRYSGRIENLVDSANGLAERCRKFSVNDDRDYEEAYRRFIFLAEEGHDSYQKLIDKYSSILEEYKKTYDRERNKKIGKLFSLSLPVILPVILVMFGIPGTTYKIYQGWVDAPIENTILTFANYSPLDEKSEYLKSKTNEITGVIQDNLEENTYDDILLKRLAESFIDPDSAILAGNQRRATISVWGKSNFCKEINCTSDDLRIHTSIELLERAESLVEYIEEESIKNFKDPTKDLDSFRFSNRLAVAEFSWNETTHNPVDKELSYFSNFISGLTYLKHKDLEEAKKRFAEALKDIGRESSKTINKEVVDHFLKKVQDKRESVVRFYQGNTHLYSAYATNKVEEYDFAINDFNKSIELIKSNYQEDFREARKAPAMLVSYNSNILGQAPSLISSEFNQEKAIVCANQTVDSNITIDLSSDDLKSAYKYLARVYNNLGIAYTLKGDYEKALENYQKAHKSDPEIDEVCINIGRIYTLGGDYDLALKNYSRAININPKDSIAYNNLGNVYAIQGNYSDAILAYGKAIKNKPDYANYYSNQGIAYLLYSQISLQVKNAEQKHKSEKALERAIVNLERAIDINPKIGQVHYVLGKIYLNQKSDYKKAIKYFEEADGNQQYLETNGFSRRKYA